MGYEEESVKFDMTQYQRLARKLIYLAHTRSYLTYMVIMVSQLMHAPGNDICKLVDEFYNILKSFCKEVFCSK